MTTAMRRAAFTSLVVATLTGGCGRHAPPKPAVEVRTPSPDVGVDALDARRKAQLGAAAQAGVFHDFQFADRLKDSGITFVHHIVEGAGLHYKAVHYDHGTGVADVDGDGFYDIYFVNQVGGNELWKNVGGGRFTNVYLSQSALPLYVGLGDATTIDRIEVDWPSGRKTGRDRPRGQPTGAHH
jgi:hypothetical protein